MCCIYTPAGVRIPQSMSSTDFGDPPFFFPSDATVALEVLWNLLTASWWIIIQSGSDICVPLRRNCNHFDYNLTFHQAPGLQQK